MAKAKIELNLENFEELCNMFCTQEEIAAFFGVSRHTITRRIASEPEFEQAWTNGENFAKQSLKRLQWRHAQLANSAGVTMVIHMSKHYLGQHDRFLTPTVEDLDRAIRQLERSVAEAGQQPAGDAGSGGEAQAPARADGGATTH